MKVQQLAAKLNKDACDILVRNAKAMPEDKVVWQPLEQGRSVLNQLQECAVIANFTTHTLNHHTLPEMDNEVFGKSMAALDTLDKAIAALETNTTELVSAIEAFPDENLDKTVQLPWLPTPTSLAEIMMMNYWNSVYHQGQVCYIQTLYGDSEMH